MLGGTCQGKIYTVLPALERRTGGGPENIKKPDRYSKTFQKNHPRGKI